MSDVKTQKVSNNEHLPESAASLLLENQVCFPLYSASNAVIRAYRPYLEKLDLTYLQYLVLMVLWEQRQLNVKSLGERLNLNSGTLTPLLKRLETKRLVERSRSKSDERARIIKITEEGLALQSRAQGIPEKLICKVGLESAELKKLADLCRHILSTIDG
jgi:DNA-binding MarR family transcriptional regulator